MLVKHLLCIAAFWATSALSMAVRDDNPFNPDNYVITPTYDGADDGGSYSWGPLGTIIFTPTHRDWGTGWVPPNAPLSSNSTGVPLNLSFVSQGTIKWEITWNGVSGVSTAPSRVIVKITSTATGGNQANVTLNNGLGSPITTLGVSKMQTGSKYFHVTMSGGVGEIELSTSAESTRSNVGPACVAKADAVSLVIADKAVYISSAVDPTYRKDTGGKTMNVRAADGSILGDTVVGTINESITGILTGNWSLTYSRHLWGSWTDPFHSWTENFESQSDSWTDSLISEWVSITVGNWLIPHNTLIDMVDGNFLSDLINLTATDNGGSGVSASNSYAMRVHAPEECFEDTRFRENGPWTPQTGMEMHVDAGMTGTLSMTHEASGSVKETQEGLNVTLSVKWLEAKLGIIPTRETTEFWKNGVTYSWNVSGGDPLEYPDGRTWFVVIRPYWWRVNGHKDVYDANGYLGTYNWTATKYYTSTPKEDFTADVNFRAGY